MKKILLLASLFPSALIGAPYDLLDYWVANDIVRAITSTDSAVYLGGEFTRVGPRVGGAVPLDASSGQRLSGFPQVSGQVYAIAPDGSGGWYLGGNFKFVNKQPRKNLAHILSDLSLDPVWKPEPDGFVHALAVQAGAVYLGGDFSVIGAQNRARLASVDAASGTLLPWNPDQNGGYIRAITASASAIYVGGNFSNVNAGTITRNNAAAFDLINGIATAWDPNIGGTVLALALAGNSVYVGGSFTLVNGGATSRFHAAAFDPATGAVRAWNPYTTDMVYGLAVLGDTIYACGLFTSVANGAVSRSRLAAFDLVSGTARAWNPGADAIVNDIAASPNAIYAGGWFTKVNGSTDRGYLAAFDTVTGTALAWDPEPDKYVHALAVQGSTVYAGGEFWSVNGVKRNRLAALSTSTGQALAWDPDVSSGSVLSMVIKGSSVYVGGNFSSVNGSVPRPGAAAFDASTGSVRPWNPYPSGAFSTMAIHGNMLYGGMGDGASSCALAFDLVSGTALAWNPGITHSVKVLSVQGDKIYAGGSFTVVNGSVTRNHLAAFDLVTGTVQAWNPDLPLPTSPDAMVATSLGVYVGGSFGAVNNGTVPRSQLAAFDLASGIAQAWNPGISGGGTVFSLAAVPGTIFYGGYPGTVNGSVTRGAAAAFDDSLGLVSSWAPEANGAVVSHSISPDGSRLYSGGAFDWFDSLPAAHFAAVEIPVPTPTITPTFTVSPTQTPSSTVSPTRTQTPDWTATPTVTTTPTPAFRLSQAGPVVLGPIPASKDVPICLYVDEAPSSSQWEVYNMGGERVANLSFGSERDQCWTHPSVAPGLYYIKVSVKLASGGTKERLQKVVLVP